MGKEDQIGIVIGIACFSWNRAYSLTILVRQESYLLPRGHPENSFLLIFPKESPSFNAKRGIMVPGVPCVSRGKWEWECDNLCCHVLALRKQPNFQNAVFCEDRFEKIPVLYAHLTYKMMSSVFGMGRSTNSVAWKLAKCAKLILVFVLAFELP